MRIKTKWMGWAALTFAVIALLFLFLRPKSSSLTFETIKVCRGSLQVNVQATATVKPEHRLEIKPPLAGRAESVEVDMGVQVKQGQVLAWMSSSERATLLDAARAKGEKELKFWQSVYKAAPLVAPLDGTIISKNLVPGQVVQSTETVFVMSDRLIVQADVDETDLGKVKLDQGVEITLDGFPDVKQHGKVNKIAYDAIIINNVSTYKIDILFEKIPDFIRSGMTANVFFQIAQRENVLLIPMDAVRENSTVLVPSARGSPLDHKQIKLGINDGKHIEVLSGLAEGDEILRPSYVPPSQTSQGLTILPRFPGRGGRTEQR